MCGLFGFSGGKVNMDVLRKVALHNERERGGDAFGFAWLENGRLRMYKQPGRLGKAIGKLDMLEEATMVVGHVRKATHGSASDNSNNHPHSCDGGWLAHNGTISHVGLSVLGHLPTIGNCDSELIARLIELSDARTFPKRFAYGLQLASLDGSMHALLGIWRSPKVILAGTSGKHLHLGEAKCGGTYIGSLPNCLPGKISRLKTNSILTIKATA